jgi:two-component system sensor histidine kinase KdpD
MKHRCKKRELIIHPMPAGLEVYADLTMTQQVLQNIIDNACKYTPDNSPIEINCSGGEGKPFTCIVRDHGPGLPSDKIGHVFDKYARLQRQDSQVAGTGLGLAIAKAVMEAQAGTITATNHPDGGAIFTFQLPKCRIASSSSTRVEEKSATHR